MLDLIQVLKADKGLPVADTISRLIGMKSGKPKIYGWHVDPSVSDPSRAVTYLEGAVGKTPAAMGAEAFSYGSWKNAFFMPRPCMLRYNGRVAYYLDPNDYTKKLDGTPSDIANADFEGNAMMEWPLIWYKFVAGNAEGEGSFYVSDRQIDSSYKCWCNIDSGNNIIKHFYTAIYNGTGTDKLRSLSGLALTAANGNGDVALSREAEKAEANNTTANAEWYIDVFSDRQLINALLVLIGKTLDTQGAFGKGRYITTREEKESYVTGSLDDKGLFWGDTSGTTSAVKVFGMENWWGAAFRRIAGMLVRWDLQNARYVKLTYGTADGSSVNGYSFTDKTGYLTFPGSHPHCGYIRKMTFSEYGMLPSVVSESDTGYYKDYNAHWDDSGFLLGSGPQTLDGNGKGFGAFETHIIADGPDCKMTSALSCKPVRA